MLKPRRHHVGGTTTYTSLPTSAPPTNVPNTTPTGCNTSQQRSAAAWAWFEHGGSTPCITPRKAEGLIVLKCNAKGNISGRPSRFLQEVLSRMQRHSFGLSEYDATAAIDYGRRRHSFHEYDNLLAGLTSTSVQTFISSGRISTAPKSWSFRMQYGAGAKSKNEVEDEETRHKDQTLTSSLLDESEIEAVFRQLRSHLRTRTEGSACSAGTHKLYVYEVQSQKHLESPRSSKSSDNHKISPDRRHCENGNDHALHRFLRLRSKILGSSSRSTSNSTSIHPVCSSIATADSIIDHHRPLPKQLTGGKTSKLITPIMMSHPRPQYSKSHYTRDDVESRAKCTQHRHVLHKHVHHIHHHHYHHLPQAALDAEMNGDLPPLLTPPN